MSIGFSSTLQKQIDAAFRTAQKKRASRYMCPQCEKEMALMTLSGAGVAIGKICRFCSYHTFGQKESSRKE